VLGMEKGQWFPFKGTREKYETNEQAAIREINEETCGVVKLENIELKCNYSTKRKNYHIGLIKIQCDVIDKFYKNRAQITINNYDNNYDVFLEKSDIKMFPLESIFNNNFHSVTVIPINYYLPYLKLLETQINNIENIKISPYLTSISNKRIQQKNVYDNISILRV
jgi:8-oxo-dGTP pyrophosphatase MutT (NUDIX family)